MARRHAPSTAIPFLPAGSSPSGSPASKHLHATPAASSRRASRLCVLALIVALVVVERAAVFAAPSPRAPVDVDATPALERRAVGDVPRNDSKEEREEMTHQSAEVGVAYFIQIAENTVDHLPRLLRRLYHPGNVYAIHFDLKIPQDVVRRAEADIRANSVYAQSVHIMPSELITYRGISMLLNTINAMRLLLDNDAKWDYFINLSGADYPLVSAQLQRKLLAKEKGLNYFTFAPKRTWDKMAENRLGEVWYDEGISFRKTASLGELTRLPIRNPIVDNRQFEISHAEAWMIASRQFCDFVVRGDMARKMLVAFAYAVDSSEHYFASLAWNHEHYKKSIVPHSMRMIVWMHKGKLSGQHPYYIDEKEEDGQYKFQEEVANSVLFFARKFQTPNSPLMDLIDRRTDNTELVDKVTDHISRKVSRRARRVAEL